MQPSSTQIECILHVLEVPGWASLTFIMLPNSYLLPILCLSSRPFFLTTTFHHHHLPPPLSKQTTISSFLSLHFTYNLNIRSRPNAVASIKTMSDSSNSSTSSASYFIFVYGLYAYCSRTLIDEVSFFVFNSTQVHFCGMSLLNDISTAMWANKQTDLYTNSHVYVTADSGASRKFVRSSPIRCCGHLGLVLQSA